MRVMLALAAGLLTADMARTGALAAVSDEPAVAVRHVVEDIASFTRWPSPRAMLRLCVVGEPQYAEQLFAGDVHAGAIPIMPERRSDSDPRLGEGCDVVYEGPLDANERARVVRGITGFPVLTIGEAAPGCIEATMFCLEARGTQVPFSSNLDAIARSGVRLNPRVLLLGRHAAGPK